MRKIFAILFLAVSLLNANKLSTDSKVFQEILKSIIGDDKYIINNEEISIKVPKFADNPVQVPIFADASKIADAKRLVIFADYNPFPKIIDMQTQNILPVFSTNIKVAHETPLRVLVQDSNNLWHLKSANINSNGGGCDVSSQASINKEFEKLLGETKGKIFDKKSKKRIKASIFHPMETGLIFGNPEFYIDRIVIKNEDKVISKIQTTSVISENPRFTFEFIKDYGNLSIHFIDNTGNDFKLDL